MTINMRTTTRRLLACDNHKRCKTNKIKIMMTRRITNNCNEERGEGK
jgi:hypothetical protein